MSWLPLSSKQFGIEAATDGSRTAYIDSKMAEMNRQKAAAAAEVAASTSSNTMGAEALARTRAGELPRERRPAGMGKLEEIDLGPDATLRNIERTVAATKRLENGALADVEDAGSGGKVRLGRDGKPWRGRKRRTSEDIRRDQLVEEVLRESRCRFTSSKALLWLVLQNCS